MNILLFYPPGDMYQRGEDRCQSNIKSSTSTSMRACNDLGYIAAILRDKHNIKIKDYPSENLNMKNLIKDINTFKPQFLVLSTTNGTIYYDLKVIKYIKTHTSFNGKILLKGAIFFNASKDLLKQLPLKYVDFLVGGEIDWVINDIVNQTKAFKDIPGIFYKENNIWHKTKFDCWNEDLDNIPFPARDLMPNHLYTRPDTGEPMATIQTSRGCPSSCIYCLSPTISGKKIRMRSPQNVMDELSECYHKYGIKNFFFKADTFTFYKDWVLELCDLIKKSDLNGKIAYTANSRVKPISEEVIKAMKETGCFTIAFGFETGNEETMKKIKKGVIIEDNYKAMEYCKKYDLPVYGFFMIGFPWETKTHIKDTEKMIFNLDCDFIEIHIALPYYGSEFYKICEEENTLMDNILGNDYFHASTIGTKYLFNDELLDIRKKILFKYHFRFSYIFKKLKYCTNPRIFLNYVKYALRLIFGLFK